jgi:hypothetical protein
MKDPTKKLRRLSIASRKKRLNIVIDEVLRDARPGEVEAIAVHLVHIGLGMLDDGGLTNEGKVQVVSPATQRLLSLLEQHAVQYELSFDDAVEGAINSLGLTPIPPADGLFN